MISGKKKGEYFRWRVWTGQISLGVLVNYAFWRIWLLHEPHADDAAAPLRDTAPSPLAGEGISGGSACSLG
ncbi:hypothetical protein [Bradyrhizobium sp. SRS-191]|uniref:hypothetical protein n=1 Tax=Bradyrhizobium sp. SRS-191 TaxID=2962606 RepID=UPI00211DBE07|nr:hypothetical protein [Bradyrhizobium sp. SRS-191]